jgi:hypothetical protein
MNTTGTTQVGRALSWMLALVVAMLAVSAHAQDSIGVVKRSKGEVLIERGGQQLPAPKGTVLLRGDRVLTGRDAYAYIEVPGATAVAIGPETKVSVDRYVPGERRVTYRSTPRLLQGLASYLVVSRHR